MSRYKLLRYDKEAVTDDKLNWQIVDAELRHATEKYYQIKSPKKAQQPLFMDIIIKITVN